MKTRWRRKYVFNSTWNFESLTVVSQYTEWSQWDAVSYRLAPPISTARSSIKCTKCTPLNLNDPELPTFGTHAQHLYGQVLPHSTSKGYDEHVPLPNLQLHMRSSIRPIQSAPSSSATTWSSATISSTMPQGSLPPINTASPYASSASSSSSSSPLSTPEITIRTPITVHQPRPSRRIPIISLSELASACDDFSMSSASPGGKVSHRKPPQDLLSPLATSASSKYTSSYSPTYPSFSDEMGIEGTPFPVPFSFEEKNTFTIPTHPYTDSGEVVTCSCGCMESYTILQDLHYNV